MSFHFSEFLFLFFQILLVYVIIRIIIKKEKVGGRECLQVLSLCLGIALFMCMVVIRTESVFIHVLGIIVLVTAMVMVVHKLKKYPLRKAISLSLMGYFFYFINETMVLIVLSYLIPQFNVSPEFILTGNIFSLIHILMLYIQSILLTTVIMELKKVRWLRKRIDDNPQIQKILAYFNILLFMMLMFVLLFFESREMLANPYRWLWIGGKILIFYIGLVSYLAYMSAKLTRMQQESELKVLKYYVDEIEQQSMEIRQFKHDYQNIMLSLEGYIRDKEYEELESFFYKEILKTSKTLDEKELRLSDIKYIKNKEVKSILIAKMQKAFSLNIEIEFMAREEIERLPMESIALIRIIGILLDNAIEAVQEIEGGKILVSLLRNEQDIHLYVQNTYNGEGMDMNAIYQKGYSSKGKDRGMGLVNLSEFTRKYDNLFLKTEVQGDQFIQMVTIEG